MSIEGIKHLIQCHCVLPQYRGVNPPLFHKFVVFSLVEDDQMREKISQCNNCGVLHRVFDHCRSEILFGKDASASVRTVEDVEIALPERLAAYLKSQNIDLSTWEQVEWLVENSQESELVIRRDEQAGKTNLKILTIKKDGSFRTRNEIISDMTES
jgi:hypothetical protein